MATITRQIGPADHGQPLTLDEFIHADFEDGWLYELARGVIVVTEVPGINHGRIVGRLIEMFVVYGLNHPGVINYRASGSECRLRLPGMQSDRHPDQAVYLVPLLRDDLLGPAGSPQIVVEVVSKGGEDRDHVESAKSTFASASSEYWILDPAQQRILVLRRAGDTWEETVVAAGTTYRTHLLPGLEVRPDDLLGAPEDEVNEFGVAQRCWASDVRRATSAATALLDGARTRRSCCHCSRFHGASASIERSDKQNGLFGKDLAMTRQEILDRLHAGSS